MNNYFEVIERIYPWTCVYLWTRFDVSAFSVLLTSVPCKSRVAPLVILDFIVPAFYSFFSYLMIKKTDARVKKDDDSISFHFWEVF